MSLIGINFPGVESSKCVPKNEQNELAILVASYGDNCGAPVGNATNALSAACDGRASCAYSVDYHVLGDPVPGCAKRFEVTYTCGTSGARSAVLAPEAGFGSLLWLTCP